MVENEEKTSLKVEKITFKKMSTGKYVTIKINIPVEDWQKLDKIQKFEREELLSDKIAGKDISKAQLIKAFCKYCTLVWPDMRDLCNITKKKPDFSKLNIND